MLELFEVSCVAGTFRYNRAGNGDNDYQYSETNVIHILFNLLRIKGLYMFRALLSHPQEGLNKRHLVYCVRVISVGCYQTW
jgi:hypothetical protein